MTLTYSLNCGNSETYFELSKLIKVFYKASICQKSYNLILVIVNWDNYQYTRASQSHSRRNFITLLSIKLNYN